MHLKSPNVTSAVNENKKNSHNTSKTMMAATTSCNRQDDNGISTNTNTNNNNSSNSNNNNNNNSSNEDNVSSNTTSMDEAEVKLKKQTLEHRKQELERLLSEKSWLLQQIQKQETQILNGNYEYLTAKEIFAMLALQYKQEHGTGSGGGGGSGSGSVGGSGTSAILRRKTTVSKENQINNNNNRQSEISNRSSEYDNYPAGGSGGDVNSGSITGGDMAAQQQTAKNAMKKRVTPTPTIPNMNYTQTQRQQLLQQQMLQTNLQYAALLQHPHYQQHQTQQQQLQQQQQQQQQQHQQLQQHYQQQHQPVQQHPYHTDAISLYSMNSANVATLRQQHVAPQQQPIVVQCDRYYLSPTHQSYNDGGFIKSSQNIKKYVSPMASPTQPQHQHHGHDLLLEEKDALQLQHPPHVMPSQHKLQRMLWYPAQQQEYTSLRHLDAISLAPSYISVDGEMQNMRWRSQSNLPPAPHIMPQASTTLTSHSNQDTKSHSSDMLANSNYHVVRTNPPAHLKPKLLDEISISSTNSETPKPKSPKPKQWLESSLDGPVIRTQSVSTTHTTLEMFQNTSTSVRLPSSKAHVAATTSMGANSVNAARERGKLSSQSMSSARHYSMSSHKHPLHSKLLADDDGRYAKLSQSTSYLNNMEQMASSSSISAAYQLDAMPTNTCIDLPPPPKTFTYLPPKPNTVTPCTPPPPPRPPPAVEKVVSSEKVATAAPLSPPDVRIESPKNMTVVQQATFQPYKEETKPFEMSDFYKYSTKFRQKDSTVSDS